VVVGAREALECRELRVGELNWLTAEPPADGTVVRAQLRYRAPAVPGRVQHDRDGLALELEEPVLAVTPGQSAVFFDESERVLGGGRIATAAMAGGTAGGLAEAAEGLAHRP